MNRMARLCALILLAAGVAWASAPDGSARRAVSRQQQPAGGAAAQRADTTAPQLVLVSPQQDGQVVDGPKFTVRVMALSLTPRVEIKLSLSNAQGVSEKTLPAAQQQIVRHEVTLAPGENILTIVASNEKASSPPLVRTLVYNPADRTQDDLLYLGVGISRYRQALPPIPFADEDAEELSRLFRPQEGGRVFDRVDATVLKNEGATRATIIEGLRWLADKADEKEDVGIVFISGHVGRSPSGEYYLLTYNHSAKSDPEIHDLSFHEIMEMLSGVRGRVLLLIDARAPLAEKSLATLSYALQGDPSAGMPLVCFAPAEAGPAEAAEASSARGTFGRALVEGLGGACDADKDGFVDTRELRSCLPERVSNSTRGRQRPTCLDAPAGARPLPVFFYRAPR